MGSTTGQYSRTLQTASLFSEQKRFVQVLLQECVPIIDADWNDFQNSFYLQIRRIIQNTIGNGAKGIAFKCSETSPTPSPNEFTLGGGNNANEGPEILFVSGHPAKLFANENYMTGINISPRSTNLTACVLTFSPGFYEDDELIGSYLVPDISTPANRYLIIDNTRNLITVGATEDMIADGASVGDYFRIELKEPSASDRKDLVYLDVYLDEYDKTDDSDIAHNSISPGLEACRRYKLIHTVFVRQGRVLTNGNYTWNGTTTVIAPSDPSSFLFIGNEIQLDSDGQYFEIASIAGTTITILNPNSLVIPTAVGQTSKAGALPTQYINGSGEYIDVDGNQHWFYPIAEINRGKLNPFITNSMITDLREELLNFGDLDDRFVNVTGDTMTGNLNFSTGAMLLGDAILGYQQLKDESVGQRHFKRSEHLLGDNDEIPSSSNLPVVHDNRYFKKSELSLLFGDNLFVNGDYSKGKDIGWQGNGNLPIWGGPAEQVLEGVQVVWMVCGPQKCCHGIETQLQGEFSGCEVAIDCQEVYVCAGGFFVYQQGFEVYAESTIPEGIKIRPFIEVQVFCSDQYMGTERYFFDRTVVIDDVPTVIDDYFLPNIGMREIRTIFQVPTATDKIHVIKGFEVIYEKTQPDCCRIGERLSIIICDVSLRKFASSGEINNNEFIPPESENSFIINPGASATIASSESRKVPDPKSVSDTGLVTYRPGWRQKELIVCHTDENLGETALVWAKDINDSLNPDCFEAVCLQGTHELLTSVGGSLTTLRIFSLNPDQIEIPLAPPPNVFSITFTGLNCPVTPGDLQITMTIPNPLIVISNVVVNPGGTSGTFDIQVSPGVVPSYFDIKFLDINTAEYDEVAMQFVLETQPAPLVYEFSRTLFPSTIGIPYPMTIEGVNFIPGQNSVVSNDVSLQVSIITETITAINVNITPQYVSSTKKSVKLTIITPNGTDEITIYICPATDEYRNGFIEGIKLSLSNGDWSTITGALCEFENGINPRLIITGTNLDDVLDVILIYAKIESRGNLTVSILGELIAPQYDVSGIGTGLVKIPKADFIIQHDGAIKADISPYILPDRGLIPIGFRLSKAGFSSRVYTWANNDQLGLVSANFVTNSNGTGFNIIGVFITPCGILQVTATLQDLGIRQIYIPIDSSGNTSASIQTKVPIDTTQSCNVIMKVPAFGLFQNVELNNLRILQIGPGLRDQSVSNIVSAIVEPIAPVINQVIPNEVEQGQSIAIVIHGTGFRSGALVTFSNLNVSVTGPITVNNDGTHIITTITALGGASLGGFNVTVTNPDLLNDTYINGMFVILPEAGLAINRDASDGGIVTGACSASININPSVDGQTIIRGTPTSLSTGLDITPFISNNGTYYYEMKFQNNFNTNIVPFIEDGNGERAYGPDIDSTSFPTNVWLPFEPDLADFNYTAIDYTDIKAIGYTFTPVSVPGTTLIKFDNMMFKAPTFVPVDIMIDDMNYASQLALDAHWQDVGANHVVNVGMAISRNVTPIINQYDCVENFSFYNDAGWEQADTVLVPCTEENIATPTRVWDAQPSGTTIELNHANYRPDHIPDRCCRNIFVETMYWTQAECRSVEAEKREYDVEDPECGCVPPGGFTQVVSEMVSDPLMYRILPDDGFNGTPTNYGESISFTYCDEHPTTNACERTTLGSQSTPDQVYFAGGGRNDPNINTGGIPTHPVTGNPIYIVVYLGPGSPQGARENLIASPITILAGSTSATIQMSPLGLQGIGVDMDVWIMNLKDPDNGGALCMIACDVMSDPTNLNKYGIYGTVTNVNLGLAQITVSWTTPTASNATFQPLWGGRVLASPADRMGFYWEASEGLIDYLGSQPGVVLHWDFKLWAAHHADCANDLYSGTGCDECGEIKAGVLLANGDGIEDKFKFFGTTGNILKERDWFKLFSAPTRDQYLLSDANIGDNVIPVTDASRFNVYDVVEILDENFYPGFRTSIAAVNLFTNELVLTGAIPPTLPGQTGFTGFKMADCAKVFRLVTRVNCQICPTELTEPDGTPQIVGNNQKCAVNFEAGTFTFSDTLDASIRLFFAFAQETYQLPAVNGVYTLRSVNAHGVESECSKLISVKNDFDPLIDFSSIARDNSRPPTQNISWANFKITNCAPGTSGTDVVNLNQLNAAIAGIPGETDPFSIHLNGSNFPTADINWGAKKITNLAAATVGSDAVRFDQIPTNITKIETGTYTGNSSSTGGARVISLTDPTITPKVVIVYHSNVAFPFFSTLAFKIGTGHSIYTLESGSSEPFLSETTIISAIGLGTFTVGNSSVAVVGANVNTNVYHYLVLA